MFQKRLCVHSFVSAVKWKAVVSQILQGIRTIIKWHTRLELIESGREVNAAPRCIPRRSAAFPLKPVCVTQKQSHQLRSETLITDGLINTVFMILQEIRRLLYHSHWMILHMNDFVIVMNEPSCSFFIWNHRELPEQNRTEITKQIFNDCSV